MNKLVYPTLIFLSSLGCNDEKAKTTEEISVGKSKVNFKIDERTEFFRTIFNLAASEILDEDILPCETEYYASVKTHFSGFKNHPLIQYIKNDENIRIDFPTVGLMYKDLTNFEFDNNYKEELSSYGTSKHKLDSIQPLLVDFYQKSKFKEFFENNKSYYRQSVIGIESQVNTEHLFKKVQNFYQDSSKNKSLLVFVELTNNANNKAINFYDHYNTNSRAIILANFCDVPAAPNTSNQIMELDNYVRGVIYHEVSHLFTYSLLEKYIGNLNQYQSICEDCSTAELKDKIDHMIVRPLQAALSKKLDNHTEGHDFFLNKCDDVRKDIYNKLLVYDPLMGFSFEEIYIECIDLIKNSKK